MPRNARSFFIAGHLASPITRAGQGLIELAADQFFDELPRSPPDRCLDRIEPIVKKMGSRLCSSRKESGFVLTFVMAWSPVRRANVG